VQPTEIMKGWCELQTQIYPQYNSEPDGGCGTLVGYGCLPTLLSEAACPPGLDAGVTAFDAGGGCCWSSCDQGNTPIDCDKRHICGDLSLCKCTSTHCTVQVDPTIRAGYLAFDMQLANGALNGSVTGIGSHNVHMTRQP